MMNELTEKWTQCLRIVADNITPSAFRTWFEPIVPVSFINKELTLEVRSQFVVEYLEENYIQILARAIFRVFGTDTQLRYRVLIDATSGAASSMPSAAAGVEAQRQAAPVAPAAADSHFATQLNESYTFASFVAGEPNKLARVAGQHIAQQPGNNPFNPLFIHGGSGVGKTHLANAVGNQIRLLDPSKRVLYVSANTFKLQYQNAVVQNQVTGFLNFYQSVDVLIIDDIQYFAGIKGTQDTFFHIFNYLQQSHKQIILTSDRSPLQLQDIEARLLTRFKWGLTAEITKPDFALRRNILLSKMERDGITLPDEVVDFIANNVRDSVRDLEGVLASLLAHATLTEREIDMQLAEQVLSRLVDIRPQAVAMEDILGAVSEHFNIAEKAILSSARSHEVMQARHVAMYLCKELTDHSLAEIGAYIGRRTHATVLHSINLMRDQLSYDAVLRHQIQQIQSIIQR